jgi:hypothetical protein
MALGKYNTWEDLVAAYNNAQFNNGEDYKQAGNYRYIDGLGNVQGTMRTMGSAEEGNQRDVLSNLISLEANPRDAGMGRIFSADPTSGGIQDQDFVKKNGMDPWMLLPFAAAAGGAMLAGGGTGAAGTATATSGASGTAGAVAGGGGMTAAEELLAANVIPASTAAVPATSAELASMGVGDMFGGAAATTGAATGAATDSAMSMPEYANESAKLAAQSSAVPGTLLDTTLPTVSTSAGITVGNVLDAAKAAGTVYGAVNGGASQVGNATTTTQQIMDPRMDPYVYGQNGLLPRAMAQLDKPQASGLVDFGNGMNNWLGTAGVNTLGGATNAANKLMTSNIDAPTMNAASVGNVPGMTAAQVNAPGQNNVNLQPAYQDMIYGGAGNNPYLTGGIQKGINQSTNAFNNYLTDASRSTQDLLGNIRGGAIVNGAMGSSRQGIAEGRAIGDFTQNIGRAMTQFGQNNTDAAVAAQAGAYDADRNRALSAMSGLSGNQYGVASQNASMQQQANQTNYQGGLQTALTNAGFQQQANANNQSSLLTTNQLNSANQLAGINSNRALLDAAYTYGTNQDGYDLNRLGKVSGLVQPYTGLNGTTQTNQPLYQNRAGNVVAAATGAAGIYNATKDWF